MRIPRCTHAKALLAGNIQGTFREHSGNIPGTFREHSGNIQGTFREHSGNIQFSSGGGRLSHWHILSDHTIMTNKLPINYLYITNKLPIN
jgi:hypothetical protein